MYGPFPKRATDAVLDAMSDHEKISMPLLEIDTAGEKFALLILYLLPGRNKTFCQADPQKAEGGSKNIFKKNTVKCFDQ